jgi:hypothetical protein
MSSTLNKDASGNNMPLLISLLLRKIFVFGDAVFLI